MTTLSTQAQRAKAFVDLFASPLGKDVLLEIMNSGGVFSGEFSPEPGRNDYLLGRRAFAVEILSRARVTQAQMMSWVFEEEHGHEE